MKKRVKMLFRFVVKGWFTMQFYIFSKISERLTYDVFLRAVCESVEAVTPYFFSYKLRPKKAEQLVSVEKQSPNADKFAIVMQGPLVQKHNFTLETVKTYERIYPGVFIIISTWKDENAEYIERIKKETSCLIVLNEYPQYSGFLNGNYQMVSTVNGIKAAKECGKEFVFKTRCDYRFYKRGLLEFMHSMLLSYPCSDSPLYQRYRIIFTSGRRDDMYKPFFLGDQFNFGHVDDMLNFWDHKEVKQNWSWKEFNKWCKSEHFSWKQERQYTSILTKRYIKKMTGEEIDISVKAYWEYAKKYLIFFSAKDVDAYWCKYEERYEETQGVGEFYRDDSENMLLSYNWNFALWNNLYNEKLQYSDEMEKISESNYIK